MTWLLNIFGNIKNVIMAIGSLFVIGYVGKLKYDAYKAEDKLKNIETKIAKTNVIIAKTKAKAKAQAKKAETDTHIQTLKDLKQESKNIQKEMASIEKNIEVKIKTDQIKKESKRIRHGKVKFKV